MADIHQIDKNSSGAAKPDNKQGSSPGQSSRRRYSSDDVADIIRISLQNDTGKPAGTIDYDELVSIGKDVGVEPDQIDHAVHLLADERAAKEKERFLWVRFKAHCISFVLVNVFLIVLNLLTGGDTFWVGYVIFGWGLFLLGHYAGLRFAPELVEMAMQRSWSLATNKLPSYVEDDVNVSFKVGDSSGLMESQGLAFVEDGHLVIEYQNVDAVLGVMKSGIKEVSIEFDDIALAKVESKMWGSELVLKGRSLKTFRNLPGNSSGVLHLKIDKQSTNAALNLVDEIAAHK